MFCIIDEQICHSPVFIQESSDVIYSENSEKSEVLLNCTAKGSPLLHYRQGIFYLYYYFEYY